MPIYEFYCEGCNTIYNFFSKSVNTEKIPLCPRCKTIKLKRQMSVFATISGNKEEADGDMPQIDEAKMEKAMAMLAGEAEKINEDDPRQAAMLMRKLSDAAGLSLGSGMEEALSRMEAGEAPDKIEAEMGDLLEGEDPFIMNRKAKGKIRKSKPQVDEKLESLFVVVHEYPDMEEMKKRATHVASDIVENMRYFYRLDEALSGFNYIVGTTSRLGSARGPVIQPREMAKQIADISQNNRVAILFGPEDAGLNNDELKYCHLLVTIPTSDELKSINLSHAVMILCYEIFTARTPSPNRFTPKLATSFELEGMYDHLKEMLVKINYINPENPDYWMTNIRRFLSRTKLFSKEAQIIRGICRKVERSIENKKA
jgi:tRNA/rRNA methyltransferase